MVVASCIICDLSNERLVGVSFGFQEQLWTFVSAVMSINCT